MTAKAYIVANEQQEREVLDKLERDGFTWFGGDKPTDNKPSNWFKITIFPYVIFVGDVISWNFISTLEDEEVIYDGRKEEKMSDKYVVSQEFMNALEEWKIHLILEDAYFVNAEAMIDMPITVKSWWDDPYVGVGESNKRLVSIIRYMCGADAFEVEKPKKWVVRSKETDSTYCYAQLLSENNNTLFMGYSFANATRFDTKEEAESWANAHQEVIEVSE